MFHRFRTVEDGARVQVHVFIHPVKQRAVGRDLDAGRGLAAIDTAASGGEDADVAAARDESGHAHGIVAGRVHEAEAGRGDGFGVIINGGERGLAALGNRAEALLVNGRQPALLVAVARVVINARAEHLRVIFPPMNLPDELVGHGLVHRALNQQMLRTINLRRLGEHGRAAVRDEPIAGHAERGIGGDAAVAIGAAAVFGEDEFADGLRGAACGVGQREKFRHRRDPSLDAFAHAAGALNGHERRRVFAGLEFGEIVILAQPADLVHLAAETDHHVAGNVRMPRHAHGDAFEQLQTFRRRDAATHLVRERDDAIHVRKIAAQVLVAETFLDVARHGGRAVDRGNDGEVIARADLAAGTEEAWERALVRGRRDGPHVRARRVIARVGLTDEIVRMDVCARRDVALREADDLSVAPHRCAIGDGDKRNFVSGRNGLRHGEASGVGQEFPACLHRALGHGDLIARVQADEGVIEVVGHARRMEEKLQTPNRKSGRTAVPAARTFFALDNARGRA